jgi:hypothetical protein
MQGEESSAGNVEIWKTEGSPAGNVEMLEKVSVFYNCDVEEGSKVGNFVMLKEGEVGGPESPYLHPKRAELQLQGNRLVNYLLEPS